MNDMNGKTSNIHYSNMYSVTFSENFVYVIKEWPDRNVAQRFVKIMEHVKMLDAKRASHCEAKKIMMR